VGPKSGRNQGELHDWLRQGKGKGPMRNQRGGKKRGKWRAKDHLVVSKSAGLKI